MEQEDIIQAINEKYKKLGENPDTYFKGLLQAKPITYWDYVEVDTLLSLQKPRTPFKDEEIFIMYHQVTEILLKMLLHEIKQLQNSESLTEDVWIDKLGRMNRYVFMLINSFDIMKDGMDYQDYNTFRSTLTPASGFQSAQFRYVEIYCTPLKNLVNEEGNKRLSKNPTIEEYFENIYWRDAGYNREAKSRTLTLSLFEDKYLNIFTALAKEVQGNTLAEKFLKMGNPSSGLKEKLLEFDKLYNVEWPMVHIRTADYYLNSKGENKAATGGSEWKKYLHPKYQQRRFFPSLWKEEVENGQ